MKLTIRIAIGVLGAVGVVAWSLLLVGLLYIGHRLAGLNMGASAASISGLSPLEMLLIFAIWLLPASAFVVMLLASLNRLHGSQRRIGYWYTLVILIIVTCALLLGFRGLEMRPIGLVFMLFSALWGFGFRENAGRTDKRQMPVE